jgi:two-component system cell cycle sensor histidine kinase/response regulator CckA
VITAEHGLAALDIWATSRDRIDLVLTDIVMPELGGRELVGRLRADRPDLRVVFVSGYDERAGLDELPPNAGFVFKPFDSRELLARLREIIER